MEEYIKIAKDAVEAYVKEGKIMMPPADLPESLA